MLFWLKEGVCFFGKMMFMPAVLCVMISGVILSEHSLDLTSRLALAQMESLKGNVTFPSNELVDGAIITLGNDNFSRQVSSDSNGNYRFHDIPPGLYILFATGWAENKAGMFKTGIEITSETPLPLVVNIVLSDSQPNS